MLEPRLQAPGAGLPRWETILLKHVVLPFTLKVTPWDEAQKMFLEQTDRIIGIYQRIRPENRTKKILIPRLTGLEDSSRYWSANMTLEHLLIVTQGITKTIEILGAEKTSSNRTGTADVKPKGLSDEDMVGGFWETMHQCAGRLGEDFTNRNSIATHDHPWFGPLNTHGWHSLLPLHHGIHRRQLEKIAAGL